MTPPSSTEPLPPDERPQFAAGESAPATAPDNAPRATGPGVRQFAPWGAAACLALAAAWLSQRDFSAGAKANSLRLQQALTELELKTSQQQLEAERIIARRQQRDAQQQVAQLTSELETKADLATFKITTLASMLKNSPQAVAVAVWDPAKEEGVLKVEKLPALLPTQDYQFWIVDPQYPNPVDGGVFTVDPKTGEARMQFKAKQRVGAVNAFAVTLERKGGVPKAEGPFVLLGK